MIFTQCALVSLVPERFLALGTVCLPGTGFDGDEKLYKTEDVRVYVCVRVCMCGCFLLTLALFPTTHGRQSGNEIIMRAKRNQPNRRGRVSPDRTPFIYSPRGERAAIVTTGRIRQAKRPRQDTG